jgi:methylation protein EvaC
LENEEDQGLNDPKTYLQFKQNCEHYRIQLVNLLEQIRKKGQSISGYAATSKSTTITNYCKINTDLIDCIYDSTPIKQGKFNPGTHIPIRPHQEFNENYPDYAVLFGYNHSKEIFAKEQNFIEQGGKWIVYVPQIEII